MCAYLMRRWAFTHILCATRGTPPAHPSTSKWRIVQNRGPGANEASIRSPGGSHKAPSTRPGGSQKAPGRLPGTPTRGIQDGPVPEPKKLN